MISVVPKQLLEDWKKLDRNCLMWKKEHKFLNRKQTVTINWNRLHNYIPEFLDKKFSFVDISCGSGATLEILRYYKIQAIGVDYSNLSKKVKAPCKGCYTDENYYSEYEPLLKSQNLKYIIYDCKKIPYPFKDNHFDVLINFGAITFYGNPEIWPKILNEFSRISSRCILLGVNYGWKYEQGKNIILEWSSNQTKFKLDYHRGCVFKWTSTKF